MPTLGRCTAMVEDGEARKQIETALAVGIRDAKLLLHAGEIALACGDSDAARRYLKQSLELNTQTRSRRDWPWPAWHPLPSARHPPCGNFVTLSRRFSCWLVL